MSSPPRAQASGHSPSSFSLDLTEIRGAAKPEELSSSERKRRQTTVSSVVMEAEEGGEAAPSSSSTSPGCSRRSFPIPIPSGYHSRCIPNPLSASSLSPRGGPLEILSSSSHLSAPSRSWGSLSESEEVSVSPKTPRGSFPRSDSAYALDEIRQITKTYAKFSVIQNVKKIEKFNLNFFRNLHEKINKLKLTALDSSQVDGILRGFMRHRSEDCCRRIGDFSQMKKKDFIWVQHSLHQQWMKTFEIWHPITDLLVNRVIKLANVFMDVVRKKKQRSELTDTFLERIEGIYRRLLTQDTPGECAESILRFRLTAIRSAVFQALHPDEEMALGFLTAIYHWSRPDQFAQKVKQEMAQVFESFRLHAKAERLALVLNQTAAVQAYIDKVDPEQVARSFIVAPEPIYTAVLINGKQVPAERVEGTDVLSYQKAYFLKMFEIIYRELGIVEDDPSVFADLVNLQVSSFLENRSKGIQAFNILVLGTISYWAFYDSKLKKIFPALFAGRYLTRTQQGIVCRMEIHDSVYRVVQEKTLFVFKKSSEDPDSNQIDPEPLFSIEVCAQTAKESLGEEIAWIAQLSFKKLTRLHANDDEYVEILHILLNYVPIPGMLLELPANEHLKHIFSH